MKHPFFILSLCLLTLPLFSCGVESRAEPSSEPLEPPTLTLPTSSGLFIETNAVLSLPTQMHISRSRLVKVNQALLIDETGELRSVNEITLNLFPDAVYTGVIVQTDPSDDGYSWVGYLKDVESSQFTLIYTSGVFIGHFASPQGVYEVSSVGDDLYRIVMIDQTKLPGGEG